MTAVFSADEILYATHGRVAKGCIGNLPGKLVWDIADVTRGDWFVAMASGNEDSHDLLSEAFEMGAQGCIVDNRCRFCFSPENGTLISVSDTQVALMDLIKYWRFKASDKVIAVTGTVGRKTTVNFLEFLLRKTFRCHTAVEHSGMSCLPEVLEMPLGTDILIAEVGGVERGSVAKIGSRLVPDLAIITTTNHPVPSGERDARAAALNCEILETVKDYDNGIAVVYDQNPAVRERAKLLLGGLRSILFSESSQSVPSSEVAWLARANGPSIDETFTGADAWCAITAAKCLGLSFEGDREIVEEVDVNSAWIA